MNDSSSLWNYNNTVPKVDFSNPDEMIRANGAAEAAQTDRLKAEVEDYTQILAQLRQLYEKNNELVQKLQFMNRNTTEDIKKLIEDNNVRITQKLETLEEWDHKAFEQEMKTSISGAKEEIAESVRESSDAARDLFRETTDMGHRDNVRVYRNVQAAMITELAKQTEELGEKLDRIESLSAPDPAGGMMQKVSVGLLIAVMALQILEGAGLIAILTGILH
ncbi:MAG TPA: hypothetical protein DCF49_04800 [Lachnospiraceae bacterium]|nr:hypothetical protein [Lachnospiraceae bacterium]